MSETIPVTDSGSRTSDELQTQLASKEQLIQALTERLGETADQLDRLKRMGMDKGHPRGSGGSLSREFVEQQEQLAGKLNGFVDRFEETQAVDRILRMEEMIEELLQSVQSGGRISSSAGASSPHKASPASTAPPATAEPPTSGWEAMKAKLMNGGSGGGPASTSPAANATDSPPTPAAGSHHASTDNKSAAVATQPSPATATVADDEPLVPSPPPGPVEFNATPEKMRAAIDERDGYIAYILGRLRRAERQPYGVVNWSELTLAPVQLVKKLQEMESTLAEHLKQWEISQSLERAALTRERVRLQQIKQHLENEIRALSPASKGNAVVEARQPAPLSPQTEEKRFLKMLGIQKPSKPN